MSPCSLRSISVSFLLAGSLLSAPAWAGSGDTPTDPALARELLKRGYELRVKGQCPEAIPILERSLYLDPQPKTAMNLAACEESVGKYNNAMKHLVRAQDLAREAQLTMLGDLALKSLTDLEERMPKLVVRAPADAPRDIKVTRDGMAVPFESFGNPLPVDPGDHQIETQAPGRETTVVVIHIEPREVKEILVQTGPPKAPESTAPASVATGLRGGVADQDGSASDRSPGSNRWRTAGYVAATAGMLGVGLGAVFGATALTKYSRSKDGCTGDVCTPDAYLARNDALDSARIANVSMILGGTVAAAGIVMVLVAPSTSSSAKTARIVPTVGPGALGLRGSF